MGKNKRFILPILLVLVGARFIAPAPAFSTSDLPANSAKVVTVEGFPSIQPVHAGMFFSAAVRVTIKEGWHINAHEGLPPYFVPAVLMLGPDSPVSFAAPVRYPAGVKKSLGGSSEAYPVYEGTVAFTVDLKLKPDVQQGPVTVPMQLKIQACDNHLCLAPGTITVKVPLQVGNSGQAVMPVHPELFRETVGSLSDEAESENIISKYLSRNGVLLTFLLIFLGGLALNLTPCVYPMIPITVSYFGSQKTERPFVILGRAAAYVVGISLTYSTLGVTAALTGKILGSTLQSPFVLFGISTVLVILSFSMFGLYEIQAPAWLLNKVAAGNSRGWVGALVMGLVFGIVAAPCVDPFSIGLLTYVAAKANPYLGFIMFFTLSLGLGFPYLWLGFFSSNLQNLPRSGLWMVWVKKVFGLILLGMPLYFLNPLMPKDFNHLAVPAYLIFCGVLLGWIFTENKSGIYWFYSLFQRKDYFKKFQHAFGLFLVLTGLLVYRAWPQPVELPFQPYSSVLLQAAQKEKEPVFIDFSASWCLPCKELEVRTFSDPRVHEAFRGWVLLKADLSEYSSEPVEAIKKTYGIMGVPTLVFVGADGLERRDSRVVGFVSVEELLQKISNTKN